MHRPGSRLDAERGYGLPVFGGRGVVTPHTGLAVSEGRRRDLDLGWRLNCGTYCSGSSLGGEGGGRRRPRVDVLVRKLFARFGLVGWVDRRANRVTGSGLRLRAVRAARTTGVATSFVVTLCCTYPSNRNSWRMRATLMLP